MDKMSLEIKTLSGRKIPAPPKISTESNRKCSNSLKKLDIWLIEQAIAEATARKDNFNLIQFQHENYKNFPPASKEAMAFLEMNMPNLTLKPENSCAAIKID